MPCRAIAVAPDTRPDMHEALCRSVADGGGTLVDVEEAEALVWADPYRVDLFPETLQRNPGLEWVQLPYAGVETFLSHLDSDRQWTNAKGVYASAVAETVLALMLAGQKNLPGYARASGWSGPVGRTLGGSRVTILGGGGITEHLLPLLAPFGCDITVVRRSSEPFEGADRTVTTSRLHELLPRTDVMVLALALTAETTGIIGAPELASAAQPRLACERRPGRPCGHRRPSRSAGRRGHRWCRPGRHRSRATARRSPVVVGAELPHHPTHRQHPEDGPRPAGTVRGRERAPVLFRRDPPVTGRRGSGVLSPARRIPCPTP